jgi:6-phosphogluconolactonase (cycloisomerase 2 family)
MSKAKYIAYVGCYTLPGQADPFEETLGGVPHDDSKVGKGILALAVSSEGKLSYLANQPVVQGIPNPSYLTILEVSGEMGKEGYEPGRLCVVSEVDGEGSLFVFQIQAGDPTKLDQAGDALATGGSFPCHITSSRYPQGTETSDFLFVSNYGGQHKGAGVTTYSVGGDSGTEVTRMQSISHNGRGSGVTSGSSRQWAPHSHCCCIIDSSNIMDDVFCTDLGSDAVIRYRFQEADKMTEVGRLALPLESGPRSMMFNPDPLLSHIGAVSLEMSAQVQLVQCRKHDGCLEALGIPISVLPDGWPDDADDLFRFNKGRWASDVAWSNDGRHLFVAARLHNSISVFKLLFAEEHNKIKNARLEFLHRVPSSGKSPRSLAVCEDFLLVAHHHSHNVTCFHVDSRTGMLTLMDQIEAPLASCIKVKVPSVIC